jgi:hypothetical protein
MFVFLILHYCPLLPQHCTFYPGARGIIQTLDLRFMRRVFYHCAMGGVQPVIWKCSNSSVSCHSNTTFRAIKTCVFKCQFCFGFLSIFTLETLARLTFCFVCYRITFDQNFSLSPLSLTLLHTYIHTHTLSFSLGLSHPLSLSLSLSLTHT